MTALGVAWFWFIGALLQMAVLAAGRQVMGLGDGAIAAMSAFMAVGVGGGSLAAGRWSGDKVELGLVPFGAFGMGVSALALVWAMPSYPLACEALLVLGFAGGLFTVPLHALLQQKPAVGEKGSVFAVSNLLSTVAILLASGSMWYLDQVAGVAPDRVILVFGVFQLVASGYVLWLLPDFFLRFSLLLLTHTHLPRRGRGRRARAAARPGAAGVQPPVARRRLPGRRLRAALHPVHGLPARTSTCRWRIGC